MVGLGVFGCLQCFDVGYGLVLVGDQGDEVVVFGVVCVEIVVGFVEEGEEVFEVVDVQVVIGFDQFVQ